MNQSLKEFKKKYLGRKIYHSKKTGNNSIRLIEQPSVDSLSIEYSNLHPSKQRIGRRRSNSSELLPTSLNHKDEIIKKHIPVKIRSALRFKTLKHKKFSIIEEQADESENEGCRNQLDLSR